MSVDAFAYEMIADRLREGKAVELTDVMALQDGAIEQLVREFPNAVVMDCN